jgi:hypothetical protein
MTQPIEEKVAALEIKVELMQRQLAQYEQAFMRMGQFTEELQASLAKLQRIDE